MPWLDHEHELVVVQRQRLERGMMELADQADLDVAADGHREDLLRVPGADAEADERVVRLEPDEQAREDVRADRGCCAEDELVDHGRRSTAPAPSWSARTARSA